MQPEPGQRCIRLSLCRQEHAARELMKQVSQYWLETDNPIIYLHIKVDPNISHHSSALPMALPDPTHTQLTDFQ